MLLILPIILLFICIDNVCASENYYIYECTNGAFWKKNREIKPHKIDHSGNANCGMESARTLVMDSYTSGIGKPYNELGGDESLNNSEDFKDHYPKFIVVDGMADLDWYGFDDLNSARNHALDRLIIRGIFISESYRNELRASAPVIDPTVAKTCKYGDKFSINYNPDGYPLSATASSGFMTDVFIEFSEGFQNHVVDISGECPTVYYCSYENQIPTGSGISKTAKTYNIFRDSLDKESSGMSCSNWFSIDSEDYVGDNEKCPTYDEYMEQIAATYNTSKQGDYDALKDKLSNICHSALANRPYTDICVKSCLHYNDDINEIESEYEVYQCGFSDKLVAWIENILRWVKYIVPVILIVLSILDFIKAIASEKEDEMKKAQKNFTTRLIAAVLIFLMPILIEFILGKMGFDAESCGISNIGF